MAPAIITLVFAAVLLVFGLVITQELRDTQAPADGNLTNADEAYKAANETIVGLGSFADFWTIIVLAVVITVVIGLLITVFGGRRSR